MAITGAPSGELWANVHSCFPGQLSNLNWWKADKRSLRCEQALNLSGALNLKINAGEGGNLFPKGFGTFPSFVNAVTVMPCFTRHICMSKCSIFSLKRGSLLNVIWGSDFTDEDYRPWLKVVIVFYLWPHLPSLLYMEHLKKSTGLQFHGVPAMSELQLHIAIFHKVIAGKSLQNIK